MSRLTQRIAKLEEIANQPLCEGCDDYCPDDRRETAQEALSIIQDLMERNNKLTEIARDAKKALNVELGKMIDEIGKPARERAKLLYGIEI